MVVTSAIVGVKRMALHEVEMLGHEVKSVLRPNEDGRAVFKVMPPERLGEGVLFRCGKWKESGGRSVGGIHTLFVRGVATDIPTIAGMIKTEKVPPPSHYRSSKATSDSKKRPTTNNDDCR
jgi:hypothetical protein